MNRIKNVNDFLFDKIDDEKSAYFLGLFYADGNIFKKKKWNSYNISLTQSEKDFDIVLKLKNALETDRKITEILIKDKKYYTLSINSNKIYEDLVKLGLSENKSLIINFPTFLPDNLINHFIRGYFDGDGSVWEGQRKKMIIKKENKQGEYRERIIQNVKFNITGSNSFIPDFQNCLIEKCGLSKTKLNYSKSKEEHKHCSIEYSGRKNMKLFFDFIYKDATIYGERKYKKFKEILGL